jgi:hypothetical protein
MYFHKHIKVLLSQIIIRLALLLKVWLFLAHMYSNNHIKALFGSHK